MDASRHSRRWFLGAVGAGAGAVALGPAKAIAQPSTGATRPAVRPDRFGRIFRLPTFAARSPKVEAALRELGAPGGLLDAKDPLAAGPKALIVDPALSANNPNNPTQSAGTTFFGQFLDHDMTFDAGSRLGEPTPPESAATLARRRSISTRSTARGRSPTSISTTRATGSSSKLKVAGCSRICPVGRTTRRLSATRATTST